MTTKGLRVAALIGLSTLLFWAAMSPVVGAATAEPSIITQAWYWEPAQEESIETPVGNVQAGTPNPFCPGLPGSLGGAQQTCAPERLPTHVQNGDYEKPDMLSAVAFDFTLIPPGSKVSSFTATFLEDIDTCEPSQEQPPAQCRETGPINVAGHDIQACLIGQVIGGGDARPYKEVPDYKCSPSDPVGKRVELDKKDKRRDRGFTHEWKFDLTPFAQQWAKTFSVATGVVFFPVEPKETGQNDSWRVVFTGPKVEGGVVTKAVFEAPKGGGTIPPPGSPVPPGTDTPGFSGSTTTTTGGFPTGSSPVTTTGPTDPAAGAEAPPPTDTGETQPIAGEEPPPIKMPGYVWLAILAGLIGFSLVRSVVIEAATGIRPDGALAQITRLNAARRGGAAVAASSAPGPLDGLKSLFGGVAAKVGGAGGKIGSLFRRGK